MRRERLEEETFAEGRRDKLGGAAQCFRTAMEEVALGRMSGPMTVQQAT